MREDDGVFLVRLAERDCWRAGPYWSVYNALVLFERNV